MFLCIYDDSAATAAAKIANAIVMFRMRFGAVPDQMLRVLVNEMDIAAVPGIRVQSEAHIQRNNFQIGLIVEESSR